MAQKKLQPSEDKSMNIQIVREMPSLSEMVEGVFYISYSDIPQARLKVQGKIIKFKLEV